MALPFLFPSSPIAFFLTLDDRSKRIHFGLYLTKTKSTKIGKFTN